MPVSAVTPGVGSSQSALKSALPQRSSGANVAAPPASPPPTSAAAAAQAAPAASGSATVGLGGTIDYSSRVGVAAYAAIMNPQTATSMRTEA